MKRKLGEKTAFIVMSLLALLCMACDSSGG
jgi:hypothetical protein